jgi:chorismate mutase
MKTKEEILTKIEAIQERIAEIDRETVKLKEERRKLSDQKNIFLWVVENS